MCAEVQVRTIFLECAFGVVGLEQQQAAAVLRKSGGGGVGGAGAKYTELRRWHLPHLTADVWCGSKRAASAAATHLAVKWLK